MAEITREYLQKKRAEYSKTLTQLEGALAALDEIEADLFPAAQEAPEPVKLAETPAE